MIINSIVHHRGNEMRMDSYNTLCTLYKSCVLTSYDTKFTIL